MGVVVCTGRTSVAQRVRGLRLGADDWLSKPCHPEEVLARVEAVVRRRKHAGGTSRGPGHGRRAGDPRRPVPGLRAGRSADLTRREFEVLQLLAHAEGKVLQREEIYQRVWGYTMAHGDRSVDVFIRKVRQKLERVSPDWRYIHTHFGVGYRFDPERRDGGSPPSPRCPMPASRPTWSPRSARSRRSPSAQGAHAQRSDPGAAGQDAPGDRGAVLSSCGRDLGVQRPVAHQRPARGAREDDGHRGARGERGKPPRRARAARPGTARRGPRAPPGPTARSAGWPA